MKKFYFFMLAVLTAFAANAWSVKFTNPKGWATVYVWAWDDTFNYTGGTWPGKAMTKAGDVWTYSDDTADGVPTNIIFSGGGAQTSDLKFVDGATYNFEGVEGVEITYAKIYIPYSNYQYPVCNLHTWSPAITGGWPGKAMTKVTENGIDFWMTEINSEDLPCTVGGWLLHGEGDDNKTGDLPSAMFAADCVTTIAGVCTPLAEYTEGGDTPSAKSYVLRGEIFSGEWADYAMTEADGKWSYTGEAVPGSFGIKEVTNAVQSNWFAAAPGQPFTINEPGTYACASEDITNFVSNLTGSVTFTFDPAALTLEVTGGEVVPVDYTSWYLNVVGDFNEWIAEGVAFSADGTATANNLAIGLSPFKIKIWNGSADLWYSNGGEVALDTDITITGNADADMIIAGATDTDVYDVSFDAVNNVLKVVLSGSSSIETIVAEENAPVMYFNLQGMRVDNPAAGLYIRRQGNTATKVLVK